MLEQNLNLSAWLRSEMCVAGFVGSELGLIAMKYGGVHLSESDRYSG